MKKVIYIVSMMVMVVPGWGLDVVFRYDDYRLHEDSLQERLIEVFAEEQVPLHIAVVPYDTDSTPILEEKSVERVRELVNEGILQIALHGFNHQYHGEMAHGEFMELTYDEQKYRLELGSRLLDSIFGKRVHIFIPPWNKYNQDTQDILADLGYTIISHDAYDVASMADTRFQYYPEMMDHPAKLRKVVKKNAKREGLMVCMFHPYDFTDAFTMEDLQELLRELKAKEGVRIVTIDEVYERDKTFTAERIAENLRHPLLTKVLGTRPIILTIAEAKKLRAIDWLLQMAVLLMILCAGACVVGWKNRRYWMAEVVVLVLAGMQIWWQWMVPKWGIAIMIAVVVSIIIIAKWRVESGK